MLTIKTPATSANLGPGFDCLGLALNIYNSFEVELSDHTFLENIEERFNNENNLFLKAYRRGCQEIGVNDHIHAVFHCDIPVSRGLGSSASLITAGITAASILHDDALSEEEIFALASEMEGHPDNAAPCIYGGLTASMVNDGRFVTHQLPLSDNWKFTVFIPDFEVSTEQARSILPESYPRAVASQNAAHAIMMVSALQSGNPFFLKEAAIDQIHEPYRKKLIHNFDDLKKIAEDSTDGRFLISGSGSTCILISTLDLSDQAITKIQALPHHWQIHSVKPALQGTEIWSSIDEK